jgi:hypothetical protein
VFLQGYRPGALARLGLGAEALAAAYPGLVVASLSAWGETGPWASRRGFDSLVQTATGFNRAEAQAAGKAAPMAMPVQILDYVAGHLLAPPGLQRHAEDGQDQPGASQRQGNDQRQRDAEARHVDPDDANALDFLRQQIQRQRELS